MEYIDLGLPSGLLWADRNLGADNPEDAGLYYAWGETTGYADAAARNTALGRSDGFSSDAYTATGASAISANLTLTQDAAQAYMGADWRMPTKTEIDELLSGCYRNWTTKGGVKGRLFTSKTNGNSIFLPAVGNYNGTSLYDRGTYGYYLSSTYVDSSSIFALYFESFNIKNDVMARYRGMSIRAVKDSGLEPEPEPEDLTREELNYSSNAAVVYEENQYTLPVLTNVHGLELTYNSSDTNVATINSSGIVSIIGNGTTTISATFAGNSDYNAKTISYILIVDIKKYLDYKGLEIFKQQLDIEFNKKANSSTVQGIIDDIGDNSTLNSVKGRIKVIEDKIPSAASSDNQLADKNFVNSSVATNTATYKGNYNVVSDLELSYNSTHLEIAQALALEISLADNNDYCFVLIPTSNSSYEEIKVIERYKFDGINWNYEYSLNNSGFTSNLWKALNSGITSELITTFNNKYDKPSGGIPKTDLSSTVQSSLDKADTALQLHQDISGKVDKISGKGLSTNDYTDAEKNKVVANEIAITTLQNTIKDNEQVTAAALDDLDDRLKEIDNLLEPITDKLDNIEEFAEVNVLSDWNQTDSSADDYIKNKPDVYTKTEIDNIITDNELIISSALNDLYERITQLEKRLSSLS